LLRNIYLRAQRKRSEKAAGAKLNVERRAQRVQSPLRAEARKRYAVGVRAKSAMVAQQRVQSPLRAFAGSKTAARVF
jgi:hypothetical protein